VEQVGFLTTIFANSAFHSITTQQIYFSHWVSSLAANPLVNNATYITSQLSDLGAKLGQVI
jgi:hypothetical protein